MAVHGVSTDLHALARRVACLHVELVPLSSHGLLESGTICLELGWVSTSHLVGLFDIRESRVEERGREEGKRDTLSRNIAT